MKGALEGAKKCWGRREMTLSQKPRKSRIHHSGEFRKGVQRVGWSSDDIVHRLVGKEAPM